MILPITEKYGCLVQYAVDSEEDLVKRAAIHGHLEEEASTKTSRQKYIVTSKHC